MLVAIENIICGISFMSSICDTYNEIIPNNIIKNKINLQFYVGTTEYDFKTYNVRSGLDILYHPHYNNSKKTVFYMHGYSEKPRDHVSGDSIDPMVKAFLKQDVNLIVVNYQDLVPHYGIQIGNSSFDVLGLNRNVGYLRSVKHIPQIGKHCSKMLRDFVKACKCNDRIHLIGFSLGAHVAHYMAQGPISLGMMIARITGLEPAAPLFEYNPLEPHLSSKDGKFVDIVHTNAGLFQYGWSKSVGHVDFWPNGGTKVQPPCGTDTSAKCSHYCSVWFYVESINSMNTFNSNKCDNAKKWKDKSCSNWGTTTYFGYQVNISVSGNYFFSTNAQSPFGRYDVGLYP